MNQLLNILIDSVLICLIQYFKRDFRFNQQKLSGECLKELIKYPVVSGKIKIVL